jgi:hypothetical protein
MVIFEIKNENKITDKNNTWKDKLIQPKIIKQITCLNIDINMTTKHINHQ